MKRLIIGVLLIVTAIIIAFYSTNTSASPMLQALSQSLGALSPAITEKDSSQSRLDVKYKFIILSDSHGDEQVFPMIVEDITEMNDVRFVAHLGDLANGGELSELRKAKAQLDRIDPPVYVLPGDHDLNWVPQRDTRNFQQVFGLERTTYGQQVEDEYFLFIDASDSRNGISDEAWSWLENALAENSRRNIYVFMSTPISNPFITFKEMGSQNDEVKEQARKLAALLKEHQVRAIFAGDTHTYSQFEDAETGIPVITVGAAGTNKNPLPLYVVVEILSDGSYNVSSIPYYKGVNE